MRVRARFFLAFFAVVGIACGALLQTFSDELRPALLQSAEETLVDSAQLLAELARDDLENGRIATGVFAAGIDRFLARKFTADIWGVTKSTADHRVYVTDAHGIVVFDSARLALGQDYSRWRDVALTLRGRYGARSSRLVADDPTSSTMYVAAPIRGVGGGSLRGVLSIGKPTRSFEPFIRRSTRNLRIAGLLVLLSSLALGFGLSWWLSRAFAKLADYAAKVSAGQRAVLPDVGRGELGVLAQSLVRMRVELEGKEYVEQYVHSLTHEMKSPLAAIRGAAELMEETMDEAARRRFLGNIQRESLFLQELIDRLLDLAKLEKRQDLRDVEELELADLLRGLVDDKAPLAAAKGVRVEGPGEGPWRVRGERFLLRQAFANLLDNALAFSPPGATVTWRIEQEAPGGAVQVHLVDRGPGIPDYARDRIFERFYSLPRPDGSRKGSGLGLPFVREALALHGGSVALRNLPGGGVDASVRLPAAG